MSGGEVWDDKGLYNAILNTWETESNEILRLRQTLDEQTLIKAVKLIGDCKGRIVLSGCGTSAAAGKKIAHSLCCVERPSCFLTPSDAVHGALGLLQTGDVLVLISKGGNTKEIINLIPACKQKGATLIGVTENPESILGTQCDLLLPVKVFREPCPFNMLATASTLVVIATFDAICIALMHYTNYTLEKFALIHPGGAVGDRLLDKGK